DGAIVLVAQLRDRIGFPEQIRNLVQLREEGRPELVDDHGSSFWIRTTWLLLDRFPFAPGRLGKNLALVHPVERFAQFVAVAGAEPVAAGFLQKPERLRTRIERNEVGLHAAFALREDLADDALGRSAAGVLAVGEDEHVLAEDAGAIEVGARLRDRLAD